MWVSWRGAATLALALLLACGGEPVEIEPDPGEVVDEVRLEVLAEAEHLPGLWTLYQPEELGVDPGLDHRTELMFSDTDRYLDEFSGGMAALDCDLDGDIDLAFTSGDGINQLFLNDGSGSFELAPDSGLANPGERTAGASVADFDRDGDPDLLMLNQFDPNRMLVNDGSCRFEDRAPELGLDDEGRSLFATWVDLDNNGWLDLYLGNYSWPASPTGEPPEPQPDRLFLADGDGGFVDVGDQLPEALQNNLTMTTAFLDLDEDGDLDLFQTNDKGGLGVGNQLFRNDGISLDGGVHLTDIREETGFDLVMDGMGLAFFDMDLDGDADVVNTGDYDTVMLDVGGTFIDAGAASGMETPLYGPLSWAVVPFDPDADGWEDIFFVQSLFFDYGPGDHEDYGGPSYFYRNAADPAGRLVRQVTPGLLGHLRTWRAVLAIDLNGDGFEDLAISEVSGSPFVFLTNPPEGATVLQVDLVGTACNTEGRHATVRLTVGDRVLTRWPGAADSYPSGAPARSTFGLDGAESAGPLEILWPSGAVQIIDEVPAGNRITIREPE